MKGETNDELKCEETKVWQGIKTRMSTMEGKKKRLGVRKLVRKEIKHEEMRLWEAV